MQFQENSSISNVNASIMNTGSIGCQYRLKLSYTYANDTYSSYSDRKALWPGASELAELKAPVFNYTGPVNSSLYVMYCDQIRGLENFTFTSTENITVNSSVESTTRSVTEEEASLELGVESGELVPVDTPPYWKASYAEIENGSATVEYEAPIFDERQNLTYLVKSGDEILGTTEVQLEARKTFVDRIMSVDRKWLFGLIGFLALINVFLLYRTLTNRN
ncbi:hypothetical protein HBNXNv_0197 [Candidatus Nanohalovita haloferacivicina]|nr:hypothetical protein HBNXNv_0197 [Candidatus Nanohalobia archaeon BNXNv]